MHLRDFESNLQKRREHNGLEFELAAGATEEILDQLIKRLGTPLPEQIRSFYVQYNGLRIISPSFEILPVSELYVEECDLVHFATADDAHRIFFDLCKTNAAGQWNIVGPEQGYVITMTLASFWSNKMWKWIDRGIPFWRSDWLTFT